MNAFNGGVNKKTKTKTFFDVSVTVLMRPAKPRSVMKATWRLVWSSSHGGWDVMLNSLKTKQNRIVSLSTRKQVIWKQDETIIFTLLELSCPGGTKRKVVGKKGTWNMWCYVSLYCQGWNVSLSYQLRYYHGKVTHLTSSLLVIGVGLHFTTVISVWLNVGRNIVSP